MSGNDRSLEKLNAEFAGDGISFGCTEKGGTAAAFIKNKFCSGTITIRGAHVISFIPSGHDEILRMAPGIKDEASTIFGGIPVCWPWFDCHRDPWHGFARSSNWEVVRTGRGSDGRNIIELRMFREELKDVELRLTAEFGEVLSLTLSTCNNGSASVTFSEALHPFFSVGEVSRIKLRGLKNRFYTDAVGGQYRKGCISKSDDLMIRGVTDRIYDSEDAVEIIDPVKGRRIHIRKYRSRNTVIWNPWRDTVGEIPEFSREEYRSMICVEAVNAGGGSITLAPGKRHSMSLIISVKKG